MLPAGGTGELYSSCHARNFGRDDQYYVVPDQLFDESFSQAWIRQLVRPHPGG